MDNPNPIFYRDLITPDDSITKLMEQLDELISKYDGAKQKIQGAAAEISKGLQGVAGASEDQRKQIQLSTEATDKLTAEYRQIFSAQLELKRESLELAAAKKEETTITKLLQQLNVSAEGSYNKLSAQYRLNKIRLNEMSDAERTGTEAGRKLEAETKAIYEKMNDLQKSTGKAQLQVGQYERALGGLLGVNGNLISSLTDSNTAINTFKGVLKSLATPIGAIIGAIGGAVAVFKLFQSSVRSTQDTGDALDREMAGWNATWDLFKKSVASVDFRLFINGAADAMRAGRELKMVLDETFERTNSARILRASMSAENAALQETMRNQKLSLEERTAAANKYLENMKPIYEQEQETARRNRNAQLEYLFTVTNRQKFATNEEREAAKERLAIYIRDYNLNEDNIKLAQKYLQAQKDVSAAEKGLQKAGTTRMTEYYDQQRKTSQAIVDKADEQTKALAKIVSQYNLTNDEQVKAYVNAQVAYDESMAAAYNDQRRIITMRDSLEAQELQKRQSRAAAAQKAAEDEAKAAQKAAEDKIKADEKAAAEAEKARQKEIADQRAVLQFNIQTVQLQIAATRDGTNEMLQLRIDALNKQRELELFENKNKEEKLRQSEQAINAKYDALILKQTSDFNVEIARRDLAAQQDLAEKEFSLLDRNERQKRLFRLQQEQARLEATLAINEKSSEKMTEQEVAAIRAAIAAIKKETERTGYKNIYELLGIKLDSDQQSALNTALGSIKDSISSIISSWEQAAEAAVKASEAQVSAAQKTLDEQIEARNAGYANNVEMAQKELALAKSNEEAALKERERAQKAQLAIDTITQASSLITATANIWSSLSKVPVVGPALAISTIATMWGSFAAAKIKAAIVTRQSSEEYGEGTVELLQGGSHASGHDIDLGTKPDGTRRRAEGGEFFAVINKRNSRRYRDIIPDVINSFNDGTFAERYQRANAEMSGFAIGMMGATDVSGIEKDVAAIRKQGDESRYVDGNGNIIIRYRNLTRKIKS